MLVELTEADWLSACAIGCARQLRALLKSRRPATATVDEQAEHGITWHCRGALGELVVAQWLGVEFAPGPQLDAIDVGPLHVRSGLRPTDSLLVRDKDADDAVFVLVTGYALEFVIRGWILGKRAKQEAWKYVGTDGKWRGCYYVPQKNLRTDLDKLRERALAKIGKTQ